MVLLEMFDSTKADKNSAEVTPRERRTHPRYAFSAAAEAAHADTRILGRISDLCSGGCYADTINPFSVGTDVRIRISRGNATFVAQAKVIYAAQGMGMGLKFTKIEPERLAVLQEWLRELSGESTAHPEAMEHGDEDHREQSANNEQQYVLNELIIALMRKHVLTDAEGKAMLKKLLH